MNSFFSWIYLFVSDSLVTVILRTAIRIAKNAVPTFCEFKRIYFACQSACSYLQYNECDWLELIWLKSRSKTLQQTTAPHTDFLLFRIVSIAQDSAQRLCRHSFQRLFITHAQITVPCCLCAHNQTSKGMTLFITQCWRGQLFNTPNIVDSFFSRFFFYFGSMWFLYNWNRKKNAEQICTGKRECRSHLHTTQTWPSFAECELIECLIIFSCRTVVALCVIWELPVTFVRNNASR